MKSANSKCDTEDQSEYTDIQVKIQTTLDIYAESMMEKKKESIQELNGKIRIK